MTDLSALAHRVMDLAGPSREVDCLIAAATGWNIEGSSTTWADYVSAFGIEVAVDAATSHQSIYKLLPAFTASLDAAMTLVPEGWAVARLKQGELETWYVDLRPLSWVYPWKHAKAATPALALTAAALLARGEHNRD